MRSAASRTPTSPDLHRTGASSAPFWALGVIAFVYGSTHLAVHDALAYLSVPLLLAVRFTFAAAALSWCRPSGAEWRAALVLGSLLFGMYVCYTSGLRETTPSNAAFIMGCSVLWVPLLSGRFGARLPLGVWQASTVGVAGLGLLTFEPGVRVAWGDAMTFLGSFLFAVYLVALAVMSKRHEPLPLTFAQLCVMSTLAWAWALPNVEELTRVPARALVVAAALGLIANAGVMCLQVYVLRRLDVTRVAPWKLLEPTFAVALGVATTGTLPSVHVLAGGSVILLALAISVRTRAASAPLALLTPVSRRRPYGSRWRWNMNSSPEQTVRNSPPERRYELVVRAEGGAFVIRVESAHEGGRVREFASVLRALECIERDLDGTLDFSGPGVR